MGETQRITPHEAPSVVLWGHEEPLIAAALVFKMFDWNVTVVCDEEKRDMVQTRLGAFPTRGACTVEASPTRLALYPDFAVRSGCADGSNEGLATLMGPATTQIELIGVRYDDESGDAWVSCSDLIAYMRSGLGVHTRLRDDEGIHGLPYLSAGHLTSFFLGVYTVMLANAALWSPTRPRLISISAQEAILATLNNATGYAQLEGRDISRNPDPPVARIARCRNGWVMIAQPATHQQESLATLLGVPPELAADRTEMAKAVAAWCAGRTREEIIAALQECRIPTSYLASPEDVFANEHLAERGFFANAPPGAYPFNRPYRITTAADTELPEASGGPSPISLRPSAPYPPSTYLPLNGLLVCDLSWAWAGPHMAHRMAMLGATIVRVETRNRFDTRRELPPYVEGEGGYYDRAACHLATDRGKLSIAADLKHPAGLQVAKDLAAISDILIANFSPGTLERLGIGFDEVATLVGRRGFIYLAMSGFGESGPWRSFRSYGSQLADLTGLTGLIGTPESGPVSMGMPFADPLSGIFGAALVLHYLQEARARKTPLRIELAQFELLLSGLAGALLEGKQMGNRRWGDLPGTGVYPCSEPDSWLAICVRKPEHLQLLASIVGTGEMEGLEARVAAWVAGRTCREAAAGLRGRGLDCTEVLSGAELLEDKGLRASSYWVRSPEGLLMPNAPWTTDGKRTAYVGPAPRLGEHTDTVLRDLLGYSPERIEKLRQSGALA